MDERPETKSVAKKLCARCKEFKPVSEYKQFMKRGKPTLYAYCTPCKREAYKEWHSNNLEKRLEINKKWGEKNPERKAEHRRETYERRRVRCLWNYAWMTIKNRINSKREREVKYWSDKKILITELEFKEMFEKSEVCNICRIPFCDTKTKTVDRIDSSGHYEKNNIQFICRSCHGRKTREDAQRRSYEQG